jgi:hypothetical protein
MVLKPTYEKMTTKDLQRIVSILNDHLFYLLNKKDNKKEEQFINYVCSILENLANNADTKGKQISLIAWKNI